MHIVIIGNGVAGCSAAETIFKMCPQAEVSVVTREKEPLYSACVLPDYLAGRIERDRVFINTEWNNRRPGFQVIFDEQVREIKPEEKKVVCSRELSYDRLIIAVGARPARPSLPGSSLPGNVFLKTLADADHLKNLSIRRAVVVGSGPVGVETALALAERGCQVSLVEMQDRILPGVFDGFISHLAKRLLREGGIQSWCDAVVSAVLGEDKVEGVQVGNRTIPCDTVIWSAGMKPDTGFLAGSGVRLSSAGFVVVNECMETNYHGIFSCGDCAAVYSSISRKVKSSMLWAAARAGGIAAGWNAAGQRRPTGLFINRVVVNIRGSCFAALGEMPAEADRSQEYQKGDRLYRLLFSGDELVYGQAVNDPHTLGLLHSFLMKKGMRLRVLEFMEQLPQVSGGFHSARWVRSSSQSKKRSQF